MTASPYLIPDTNGSAVLGWCAALAVVLLVRFGAVSLGSLYFVGILAHLVGFHWIPASIMRFGGIPWPLAVLLFLIFALVYAIQFPLFGWLYRSATKRTGLRKWCLDVPIAWLTAEMLVPHVFPWSLALSQIRVIPFSSLAEFFGVPLLSALMMWTAVAFLDGVRSVRRGQSSRRPLMVGGTASVLLAIGWLADERAQQARAAARTHSIGLVQCNSNPEAKGDRGDALDVCRQLSREAAAQGAELIIWPESVMKFGIPDRLTTLRNTRFAPAPELDVPIVFSALTFAPKSPEELPLAGTRPDGSVDRHRKFSAAIAVSSEGSITSRYHKRRLMPFGEYMPLSSWFPFLKKLSPRTRDFTAGRIVAPMAVQLGDETLQLGALICYEDLVPDLARDVAMRGADILVNQTNDAWYGDSLEPYQHHLLAQWRAIETRRYLLRATNTGYTTVINSSGQTVASLPTFQKGVLLHSSPSLTGETLFMRVGSLPAWLVTGLTLALVVQGWWRSRPLRWQNLNIKSE